MSPASLDELGKLTLRLTIGILLLMHGIAKLLHGVGPIEGMMVARELPAFLELAVYVGELLAPLLCGLGVYTCLGVFLIFMNMVFAIALVGTVHLSHITISCDWLLELQGFYLFGGLAI